MTYLDSTQVGWVTLEEARAQWSDAPLDNDVLGPLLESAYDQCAAFAPALADELVFPTRYTQAQVLQARGIYRAMTAGGSDQLSAEGFTVTVFPMDWNVKALLRPKRGAPLVG